MMNDALDGLAAGIVAFGAVVAAVCGYARWVLAKGSEDDDQ